MNSFEINKQQILWQNYAKVKETEKWSWEWDGTSLLPHNLILSSIILKLLTNHEPVQSYRSKPKINWRLSGVFIVNLLVAGVH